MTNGSTADKELYTKSLYYAFSSNNDYEQSQNKLKEYLGLIGETLNSTLINNSEGFQQSISDVPYTGVKVYNIVGYNIPTIGHILMFKNPLSNICWISPSYNLTGDGTVSLRSAEIIGNSKKTMADVTYYIKDVKHDDLPSNDEVISVVKGLLNEPTIESSENRDDAYFL